MTQPYNLLPRVGSSMAEEWLAIGLEHHVANKFAEAEQAYLKGLRVDPGCVSIICNMGVMAAQQGNMLASLQRLERALLFSDDANPQQSSVVWYDYALALLEAERTDEAVPAIERSLKLGESDNAYCAQGMILTSCGLAAEASEAYDKALALSPENPAVLSNLAMFHAAKGERAEAEALLRRAVARPDATIQVRQNLALIIGLEGKLDEAERLIREDLPPEVATANLAYLRSVQPGAVAQGTAAPPTARPAAPEIR